PTGEQGPTGEKGDKGDCCVCPRFGYLYATDSQGVAESAPIILDNAVNVIPANAISGFAGQTQFYVSRSGRYLASLYVHVADVGGAEIPSLTVALYTETARRVYPGASFTNQVVQLPMSLAAALIVALDANKAFSL